MLTGIVETQNIEKDGDTRAVIRSEAGDRVIDAESPVSMNMWGMRPEFFDILESGFDTFLENTEEGNLKAEYLLPTLIGQLLEAGRLSVKVLRSRDQWFGVTYKEDKDAVVRSVSRLVEEGLYPSKLYTDK